MNFNEIRDAVSSSNSVLPIFYTNFELLNLSEIWYSQSYSHCVIYLPVLSIEMFSRVGYLIMNHFVCQFL